MFYHALAAVPEWAPPHENHILYSQGILKNVGYEASKIRYTATDKKGTEYLRLSFKPKRILLNGKQLAPSGYSVKSLGSGDYAVTIRREKSGQIIVE